MIITVQAFNNTENAVNVTAALAAMNAYKYKNPTAIIQFTEAADKDVVDVMIGKNIKQLAQNEKIGFAENGIDELVRSTQYEAIDKETIMTMCTALTTESGRLDALRRTELIDFVETAYVDLENILHILKIAADAYATVFVIMPCIQNNGDFANAKFVNKLNESEIVDASIYCFPQGPVNRIKNLKLAGKKVIYCSTDFEVSSIYGHKFLKKEFGHRIIYGLHHNVGFRDALLTENVVDFVRRNRKVSPTDVNYWWNKSVCDILKYGLGTAEYSEPNEELRIPADEPYIEEPTLRDIDVSKIKEEQIVSGRIFKKTKSYMDASEAYVEEEIGASAGVFADSEDNEDYFSADATYDDDEFAESQNLENEQIYGAAEDAQIEIDCEYGGNSEYAAMNETAIGTEPETEVEMEEDKQIEEVHSESCDNDTVQNENDDNEIMKESVTETEVGNVEPINSTNSCDETDNSEAVIETVDSTMVLNRQKEKSAPTEQSPSNDMYDEIRRIPTDLDDRAYNAIVASIIASRK